MDSDRNLYQLLFLDPYPILSPCNNNRLEQGTKNGGVGVALAYMVAHGQRLLST